MKMRRIVDVYMTTKCVKYTTAIRRFIKKYPQCEVWKELLESIFEGGITEYSDPYDNWCWSIGIEEVDDGKYYIYVIEREPEDEQSETDNSVPDTAEHSESEAVETVESEQSEDTLYEWANSLTEIQRDYLFNGGWYNHTVRSYLVAAAREANFTREQIKELLNGLRFAFSTKDKPDVERLFEEWQGGE